MPAPATARLDPAQSILVIVDVQARLAPHVLGAEGLERRCIALVKGAQVLGVPVLATEHCAEAIGATLPSIAGLLAPAQVIGKRHFSAMDEAALPRALGESGRRQVLVAGMEAHVCVMQTALGILAAGYDTRIVVDAVGSRREADSAAAIARMLAAGAGQVSTEMLLFEWLANADHPGFRKILALVKNY